MATLRLPWRWGPNTFASYIFHWKMPARRVGRRRGSGSCGTGEGGGGGGGGGKDRTRFEGNSSRLEAEAEAEVEVEPVLLHSSTLFCFFISFDLIWYNHNNRSLYSYLCHRPWCHLAGRPADPPPLSPAGFLLQSADAIKRISIRISNHFNVEMELFA